MNKLSITTLQKIKQANSIISNFHLAKKVMLFKVESEINYDKSNLIFVETFNKTEQYSLHDFQSQVILFNKIQNDLFTKLLEFDDYTNLNDTSIATRIANNLARYKHKIFDF